MYRQINIFIVISKQKNNNKKKQNKMPLGPDILWLVYGFRVSKKYMNDDRLDDDDLERLSELQDHGYDRENGLCLFIPEFGGKDVYFGFRYKLKDLDGQWINMYEIPDMTKFKPESDPLFDLMAQICKKTPKWFMFHEDRTTP